MENEREPEPGDRTDDDHERARRSAELRDNLTEKLDELHRRAVHAKEVLTPARYLASGWVRLGVGLAAGIAITEVVRGVRRDGRRERRRGRGRGRSDRERAGGTTLGDFAADVALAVVRAGLVAGIVAFGKSVIASAAKPAPE